MKTKLLKWTGGIVLTGLVFMALLTVLILNPGILYGYKTPAGQFTIYHDQPLDSTFVRRLERAQQLIAAGELYQKDMHFRVCLNDGSFYPVIMEKVRGRAYGWGMLDLAIFRGRFAADSNTVTIGRYDWNMEQLLAHELTHCMQMMHFGLFDSNPFAGYPDWKWEGYAEYIARKSTDQQDLSENYRRYLEQTTADTDRWEITFPDGTIAPKSYYEHWMLVQYCLDVRQVSYTDLIDSDDDRDLLWQEMTDRAGSH